MGKILVTGGAGYVGSTVTKLLAQSGYTPVVLDNLSTGRRELVLRGSFYEGDLASKSFLKKIFSENEIDAVMHFAAFSSVGESVKDPKRYYENNLSASLNLFAVMLESGVNRLIFSSTAAVYGLPSQIPLQEEAPCTPMSPYGATKFAIEEALKSYFDAYGLGSISLRYFNACGTENDLEVGELHSPETHLIPLAIRASLDPSRVMKVFGSDYETKDGTCIRDYIHVSDLAEAHLKALEKLMDKPCCSRLNLSNDRGFSVLEIIRAVEEVTGKKMSLSYEPRRAGDPPVLIGSSDRAREILGWAPKYTSPHKIIETAYAWQKTQKYKTFMEDLDKKSTCDRKKNGAGKGARTLDLRDGNATL